MTKLTGMPKLHSLADRLMLTCCRDLCLLLLAALIISVVSGEPDTLTRNACIAISWMAIGAAIARMHVKLRPKA